MVAKFNGKFVFSKKMNLPFFVTFFAIFDGGIQEAIDRMGDKLCHVHMADSNRMFPGYGHTDFFGIVRELKKRNYQNYLSFECLNEPSLAVVREKSGRWIETLRRL